MKKLLSVLFILLAVVTLVACGDETPDPTPTPTPGEQTPTPGEETPTPGEQTPTPGEQTPTPAEPTPTPDPINNGERIDFSETFVRRSRIRVWIDDENGAYMAAIIEEFNKLYPNIVVEHQHMGSVDARELLKTFGPSGNGADVFQFPHDHLAQAILEDLVYPLPTATRTFLETRSHELGLSIATLAYNAQTKSFDPNDENAIERLFAVPMSIESVGLFYNKDLVDVPHETYEALIAAAEIWNAAQADGLTGTNAANGLYYLATSSDWADPYFLQHIFSAFDFYPFGPELNDPSAVGFENAVPALNWLVNNLKPIATGAGGVGSVQGAANFEDGKIPYIIAGPWNHSAFREANLNYGVAPLPTINGNPTSSFAGAMMAAVYQYSNNKEEAIRFVEFLASDVAMQLMYDHQGKLPALQADLLENITGIFDDEALMMMSMQLETSVPMPTIPQVTHYWAPAREMIIDVWEKSINATTAAAEAETSYRVRVGLSG